MTDEERINAFVTALYNEINLYNENTGSGAICSALVAFGIDLGILDDTRKLSEFEFHAYFPECRYWVASVHGLFMQYHNLGEAVLKDMLYRAKYKCVPGIYVSDTEAFIRNLARIALRDNSLDRHLMHRAICTMAKELGIVSEKTWKEVLDIALNPCDYYFNIQKLRFWIDLEEKVAPSTAITTLDN